MNDGRISLSRHVDDDVQGGKGYFRKKTREEKYGQQKVRIDVHSLEGIFNDGCLDWRISFLYCTTLILDKCVDDISYTRQED